MQKRQRHDAYLWQVASLAEELGYTVEHVDIPSTIGIDMVLRNPRNNRKAYVELEHTYQQQKAHTEKISTRWNSIQQDIKNGQDAVFLWIGVRRRDLLSQAGRAGIPEPEAQYGKYLFSCVSFSDPDEIRFALLRCLGDD